MHRRTTIGIRRSGRRIGLSGLAAFALVLAGAALFPEAAFARTRRFCAYEPFDSGRNVDCGGHLQPFCTSGRAPPR